MGSWCFSHRWWPHANDVQTRKGGVCHTTSVENYTKRSWHRNWKHEAMRSGGGKSKGSGFERQVCRQLSLWITHGRHQDTLWRRGLSGGRGAVNRKLGIGNRTQCGDISAVSPEGHKLTDLFVVECKF